ncbi:hypothetical protein [Nonomuraea sp. NPDC001699]
MTDTDLTHRSTKNSAEARGATGTPTRGAITIRRAGAIIGTLLLSASLLVGATTPAQAAGGCTDRSQNDWVIRLCANRDGAVVTSDLYIIAKGWTGNGCRGSGYGTINGGQTYADLTGCSNINVNNYYRPAREWVIGSAQVTTRVVIFEDVWPFRTIFDQSATYNDV